MGLLSDTSGRKKIIVNLQKYGTVFSVISFVVGVSWMAALAHHELSAKNYFSENQLLPGMVETYFTHTLYTERMYRTLQGLCSQNEIMMKDKIVEEMSSFGLDMYSRNFYVHSNSLNGTNIIGIYRSPRASGVESIVLNVPLHKGCKSTGALAMMLGLAKYFRQQTYWAKDIIFLVTEHDMYGVKRWLEDYFHDKSSDITSNVVFGHAGSIQAAVVLDFEADYITYFDLLVEGLNGQLPNLDVIHLAVHISNYEGIPVKFRHQTYLYQPKEDYLANFETLLRTMITQSSGYPTGNHGMFYKYRIEAVTLRGRVDRKIMGSQTGKADFEQIGRMIEGIFRSVNNMLEHFHQSFFLYILPNTDRYISIGLYMPPLGCMMIPLVISLFSLWIEIFQLDQEEAEKKHVVSLSVLLNMSVFGQVVVSCIAVAVCKHIITYMLQYYRYGDVNLFAMCCFIFLFTGMASRLICVLNATSCKVMKLYIILHLAISVGILSLLNFSLAFIIASFYIPLMMTVCSFTGRFGKLIQFTTSILSSPPVLLFILCILHEISLKESNPLEFLLNNSLTLWSRVLRDNHVGLCVWTKDVVYYLVTPMWILANTLIS